MSQTNVVLDALYQLLKNDASVAPLFKDITRKEFPFCDDFPALHINSSSRREDTAILGMGFRQLEPRVQVYVTLGRQQLENMQQDIWETVDTVCACIESDRFLVVGGIPTLIQPILNLEVRSVPSPIGTAYLGTRVIEFDAKIKDTI
jgi:hypothetical protein